MTYPFYLVTDDSKSTSLSLIDIVKTAIAAGVNCVQLREKHCSTALFIEKAKQLMQLLKPYGVPLFINDRIDVALAAKADGLHLGSNDMSYQDARHIAGSDLLIGMTINHLEQIEQFNHYQIAYLGVSALFHSSVKQDITHYWDQEELQQLRQRSKHALIGIGGINTRNIKVALSYGLDGIAVSSALCHQSSLAAVQQQTKMLSEEIASCLK